MNQLNYMPCLFQSRRRARPVGAVLVGLAAAVLLVVFHLGGWKNIVLLGVWSVPFMLAGLWLVLRGGVWECRIEAGELSLRGPGQRDATRLQLSCIQRLVLYRRHSEGPEAPVPTHYEVVMAGGERIPIRILAVLGRSKEFRWALLKANPQIRYAQCGER